MKKLLLTTILLLSLVITPYFVFAHKGGMAYPEMERTIELTQKEDYKEWNEDCIWECVDKGKWGPSKCLEICEEIATDATSHDDDASE